MEVEAKFNIPDRQVYRQLARLRRLAGYTLAPAGSEKVSDRYFDTPDGRLLAAGYACRLRAQDGAVIATLKGMGTADHGIHRREEQEVLLPGWESNPQSWPASPARALALELTAGAILQPLFDLTQRRICADVRDDTRLVARLSLDQVKVHIGSPPQVYYELEIELQADGSEADLKRLAEELTVTWHLTPEPRSKFARAFEAWQARRQETASRLAAEPRVLLPTEQPRGEYELPGVALPSYVPFELSIAADEPMWEAGRKVLHLHFNRMLANEAGTRLGEDVEALHDMRVATRRMRAALRLFSPYFDARALKPFNKGLRRTGRTLGAVRDLDVLLEKARVYQASLPADQAASMELLLSYWQTSRDAARRKMLKYLDGKGYRQFVSDFKAFLTTPGAGALEIPAGEPTPYQVRHVVPALILSRYAAVRAYEPLMPNAPLATMHRLRIDCKGLRYALEFFRDVLGPETPELIKQVVGMQDLLGELQDAHVAEELLVAFLKEQHRRASKKHQQVQLEGVESYLSTLQAIQRDCLAAFPEPWAALIGDEFRHRLCRALAVL